MTYQIIEFIESTGQVILHVDGFPSFAVDLPIDENGNVPTGDELNQYLNGFIPVWQIERNQKLISGITNASEIHKLVTPLPIQPVVEQVQNVNQNDGIKSIVLEVLVEEGLIQ